MTVTTTPPRTAWSTSSSLLVSPGRPTRRATTPWLVVLATPSTRTRLRATSGEFTPSHYYNSGMTALLIVTFSKHNPFMSFDNIRENIARCQNIVNAEEHFAADVAKGKYAPQYMFYTPTLANDAHDTNVTYTEKDLKYLMKTMMDNEQFMKNTLILVTFDENGKIFFSFSVLMNVMLILLEDVYSPESYGTPNDVYSALISKDVLSCTGCVDQQFYNREYSLNSAMHYKPLAWLSFIFIC
jgi:hypothetical protein